MNDVCQLLKETRLGKGLSLDEVAQRTYIKLHYLEALEEGQLEKLPAMVHTYGYIRQYAKLLGLDGGALVAQFQQHERAATAPKAARTPTAELFNETLNFLKPIKTTYGAEANGNGASYGNGAGYAPAPTLEAPPAAYAPPPAPPAPAPELPMAPPPLSTPFAGAQPTPTAPAPSFFRPAAEPTEVLDARAQAQQILLAAEREARQLVSGAESYADEVLGQLEAEVVATLAVIQNGRHFLAARQRSGPQGLG